jgi:hypothetical protein
MAETQRDLADYQSDHDIIVRLDTKMDIMTATVEKLTNAMTSKADDHETRLRRIEGDVAAMSASSTTWRYILSFAIAIATVASTVVGLILRFH